MSAENPDLTNLYAMRARKEQDLVKLREEKAKQIQNLQEQHAQNMQRLQQEQGNELEETQSKNAEIIKGLAEQHRRAVEVAKSIAKRMQDEQETKREDLRKRQAAEANAMHKKFEEICKRAEGEIEQLAQQVSAKEGASREERARTLSKPQRTLYRILQHIYSTRWHGGAIAEQWENAMRVIKKTTARTEKGEPSKQEMLLQIAELHEKPADTVRILLQHNPWKGMEKIAMQQIAEACTKLEVASVMYSMSDTAGDIFKKVYGEDLDRDQHIPEECEEGGFDRAALEQFLQKTYKCKQLKNMLKEITEKMLSKQNVQIPSSVSSTNGDKQLIARRISELAAKPSQVFALIVEHVTVCAWDIDQMQETCKAFREACKVQQHQSMQSSRVEHMDLVQLLQEVNEPDRVNKKQRF